MPHGIEPTTAQYTTVTSSSQKFATAMAKGLQYVFMSTTNCWITKGATGGSVTASAAGACFVPANTGFLLRNTDDATTNAFVHVIRDSADGKAWLAIAPE